MPEAPREAAMLTCPSCGAPCGSAGRACPHCGVELAAARCPKCFTLNLADARFCSRCGEGQRIEPLLHVTDAPCPRCAKPLRATSRLGAFECVACGGLFVDHTAFAHLSAEKERETHPFAAPPPPTIAEPPDVEVHYVKCPACHGIMNRLNFGRRSGVIVDVCRVHGTWFDAGELTRVLEWIAGGGTAHARTGVPEPTTTSARSVARASAVLEQQRTQAEGGDAGSTADLLLEVLSSIFRRDD
jgi:Zn-finger nucleic acid-binding protein